MDRNEAITEIRQALKRRSGKSWSVRGGTGTAWGWIRISAPPARKVDGVMTESDARELGELLGLEISTDVAVQNLQWNGESVPASSDHRREYVDRANGVEPSVHGKQYWD